MFKVSTRLHVNLQISWLKLCLIYACHNVMFYTHGRQRHQSLTFLLSHWKPWVPLFYCVSVKNQGIHAAFWRQDRKLRVCFLGGRNKSTQGRIYGTLKSWERNEKIEIIWSFSLVERSLPVIQLSCVGGVVFTCSMWRSADTFLQVSFVPCCHHKPQNAMTFLRTEILEMGCFELPNKTQTLLSSQVHMCSCWIKYILSSHVKYFHSKC